MTHLYRGKCLVLNHQTFDTHTRCPPRIGTDRDALAVTKAFHNLDFDVTQLIDASYRDIHDMFVKVSREDHTDNDCLLVVVLTHGDEDSLWARDRKYPVDQLFGHFNGNRCPSLIGKPKIFIIQACRGEKLDSGVQLSAMGGEDVIDGSVPTYKIPSIADFLIYYCTAPGHYSFRNTELGSYFIRTLTRVLKEYKSKNHDLVTIFTIVNQKVAIEFESYIPDNRLFHKKKQIPCIQSMLTRLVYLTPKVL